MPRGGQVPRFGDWENAKGETYTLIFDNVRAGKGSSKLLNPNDPEFFQRQDPPAPPTRTDTSPPPPSRAPDHNLAQKLDPIGEPHASPLEGLRERERRPSSSSPLEGLKERERRPSSSSPYHRRPATRRPSTGDESPAAFPRFDELDLNHAPEYTAIFTKLQEEKKAGRGTPLHTTSGTPNRENTPLRTKVPPHQSSDGSQKWWCCFRGSEVQA